MTDLPDDTTPPDVGEDLGALDEETEQVNIPTERQFGTFAHTAYEQAADETFDDVESNKAVIVTKPDDTQAQGYIDTSINDDQVIIDYKTSDMRDWDTTRAHIEGRKHGRQVQEYVDSPDTPDDARGWIISTVPPESETVRQAYSDTLAKYDVGVKFSKGEDQNSVIEAVTEVVEESSVETTDETINVSGTPSGTLDETED